MVMYLEVFKGLVFFLFQSILIVTAMFIVMCYVVFMFEILPEKIQEFTEKRKSNNDR